jgi:hypothetical protein
VTAERSQSGAPGGRTCSGQPGGTLAPTPGSLPDVERVFDSTGGAVTRS